MNKRNNKIELNIINNESLIFSDKKKLFIYNIFFWSVSVGCILCGLIPGFISFQRIFYTKDTIIFLITYLVLITFFLISVIGFLLMSIKEKVYIKNKYSFLIILGYLIIFGLLSFNAFLFTNFKITEHGYEVPFNALMYIIDLLIIFPLYIFFDYYVLKTLKKASISTRRR